MGYDSLLINGQIELLGGPGGVPSLNPMCPGATFRVKAPADALGNDTSYDLGQPDPTQDFVESLLLDGERPFGYRASNRTITLTVIIRAKDRATVAGAREYLLETIDQQTWTMTYTRDATAGNAGSVALPMVFDCFRALPSNAHYGVAYDRTAPMTIVEITFQALPYGRSDTQTQIAFASPATQIPSAPASPVTIDSYSTVTGSGWAQSGICRVGPHSAYRQSPFSGVATYTRSGLSSMNLTGLTALTLWMGAASETFTNWLFWHSGIVSATFTLSDGTNQLSFTPSARRMDLASSNNAGAPFWHQITAQIPSASAATNITTGLPATISLAAITGYTVSVLTHSGGPYGQLCAPSVYLDQLVATPTSVQAAPASVRGWIYNLNGIPGTAHSAISVSAQQPTISNPVTVTLTGSGNWIPPAGVTSAVVGCWGGGGSGATTATAGVGGGGGGGEYAQETLSITGSAPVPYACGAGGIPGTLGTTVVQFTNAGTASFTVPAGITSLIVECWGGGGSGVQGGGGGAGGEYAANATLTVSPGQTYTITVGSGGQFTGFYNSGQAGSSTSFSGTGGTITAHGGKAGSSGTNSTPAGGTGSSAPAHVNGGAGGAAPGTGGGGGGEAGSGPPGSPTAGVAGGSGSGSTGGSAGSGGGNGGNGGAGGNSSSSGGSGVAPGGGGGSAGAYGGSPGTGAPGMVQVTYGSGSGGAATSGQSTVFGPSGAPLVTAHGGTSATTNSATGASGGTGSSNTVHFNGGSGASGTASTNGGGGGSSAGTAAVGGNGSGATAGTAPTGAGKGGAGAGSANNPGLAGVSPGGGGGGAWDSSSAQSGGAGGAGQIQITYTATLAAFSTLILHRPGHTSPQSLTPFVSTANATDPPDGREYAVPSLIATQNARFDGTYTLWLVAYNWNSPSSSRTVTITVHQYEYVGGPSVPSPVSRTFIPNNDAVSGMIDIGVLTLPYKSMAKDNTTAYFTVGIVDTNTSDQFLDVLFLDTTGQTVCLATPSPYVNFYVDAPTPDRDIGRVLGSAFDRNEAVSVTDSALAVSGGPLTVDPGDNILLAYAVEGAPALAVNLYASWFIDRLS